IYIFCLFYYQLGVLLFVHSSIASSVFHKRALMASDETTIPLSENGKSANAVVAESGRGKFTKDDETVDVQVTTQLIGLTKEQLEKYRNDPFWKPLRLILFVLFWLAWIAMFVGAILIVVLSPKCATKKAPEWWRSKVSYQVFTPTFRDSDGNGIGDFKGIEEKLDDLRKIGVQNLWVTPVIATQKDDFMPYDVVDFSEIDERFGTMQQFKEMLDAVHSHDMHFVMDLPISTTSAKHIWFDDAKQGGKYKNYYVWKKAADVEDDNNYVKLTGMDEAFLAYERRDPILNWENPEVKQALIGIAKNYLDLGVDGFHLAHVNQLMKNHGSGSFAKAALSALEGFNNELEKYIESNEALKEKKIIVFCSLNDMEDIQPNDSENYNSANLQYVIDDSVTKLDEHTCQDGVAKCLYGALENALRHFDRSKLPHIWQFTNYAVSRPTSRFDIPTGNLMTFVQMTLPGAVEIYYGQELGLTDAVNSSKPFTGLMQWDSSKYAGFTSSNQQPFFTNTADTEKLNYKAQFDLVNSPLKTFRNLAKLRQRDDNMVFSGMTLAPLINDLIMFSRVHHADDTTNTIGAAYIVVANFGSSDASVDISSLVPADRSSVDVEIVALTANDEKYRARQHINLSNEKLSLGPKQGILLRI
uniref:alpha-glucosidase n=2 Tax=Parascaris univalens TaxID=6257 RepID=A0A915AWE5_PARUN